MTAATMTTSPPPAAATGGAPLRVLFFCATPRGGTPQYTHNLMNQLGRRGHQVMLLTSLGYDLAAYASHYTVLEVIDRFKPHPGRWLQAWRTLRRFRPQVIHYQGGQHPDMTLLLDLLLRAGRSVPAVYTPQELQSNSPRRHFDMACRRLLGRMQHVVYNSEANRAFVRDRWGLSVRESSVAGVPDLLAFVRQDLRPQPPPIPAGRPLLLCFGLIEQRKGIPTLVEAFALLRRTRPDCHLAIVGKPVMDLTVLHEAIARHGLADHVDLVPEYVSFERMAGYFERAAALVLPYEAGWNSGVIPVALGYRKPVVATTIASAGEAVADGQTGLLVPPAAPQALCDALLRIVGDDALRAHMQQPLDAAAQAQGWAPLVASTEALYRRLVHATAG